MNFDAVDNLLAMLPEQMSLLQPADQQIAIQIYRRLALGQPVEIERAIEGVTGSADEISVAIARLIPEMKRDSTDNIVAFMGLSLIATAHRLIFGDRDLYAWCAWDALFLPHLLGRSVQVVSLDPVSKQPIQIDVQNGRGVFATPSATVLTFPKPSEIDTKLLKANTIGAFCSQVHFFENEESAGRWIKKHGAQKVLILDLATGYQLGIRRNQLRFPLMAQSEPRAV